MMYGATLYDQRDVRVLKAAKIEGIMGTKRKEESDLPPTNIFGSFQQSPRGSAAKGSARGSAQHSSRGLVGDIQAMGKLQYQKTKRDSIQKAGTLESQHSVVLSMFSGMAAKRNRDKDAKKTEEGSQLSAPNVVSAVEKPLSVQDKKPQTEDEDNFLGIVDAKPVENQVPTSMTK